MIFIYTFIALALSVVNPLFSVTHPTGFTTTAECVEHGAKITYLPEFTTQNHIPYVLTLNNGIAFGEGAIITQDGKILKDTETYGHDQQRLLKNNRNIAEENYFYFNGTLAVISSPGQQCYYHWLLQILPRLYLLAQSKNNFDRIYLYKNNFIYPWQQETLSAVLTFLNIPQEKILYIPEDTVVQAQHLVVPSVFWSATKDYFIAMPTVPQWFTLFFKNVFLKSIPNIKTSKKIFISRSKASYRKITNEHELSVYLETKGFSIHHLEELSIFEQTALIHNADVIIGCHGAGFANLIFCKPGTHIIEIDHGPRSAYGIMAGKLQCNYNSFYTSSLACEDEKLFNQDMTVDMPDFEKFYTKIFNN